jgi:hypothetical protein
VHATNYRIFPTGNNACAAAWSPLGDEISYGGQQESPDPKVAGPSSLYVISTLGGTPQALYTTPQGGMVFYSAWRADASAIAFNESVNNLYSIKVFNRNTGVVTAVVPPGAFYEILSLSWARGSDLLAFTVGRLLNKNLVRLEVDTIRLARDANGNFVAQGSPGFVIGGSWPAWAPNDARLAVNGINVFDLLTGSTQSLASGTRPDWRRF